MRILYLGLPLGALVLSRAGFTPRVVALGHPEAPGGMRVRRRFVRSLVLGKPDLSDDGVVRTLASARPDVLLSFFWPRRIPPAVLALPRLGAYGVHPSLLPRHRGPDPYFWAIEAGDGETGVSLHHLEETYDTGAVVAQRKVALTDGHDSWTLARALDRPALALLVHAARELSEGRTLPSVEQDDSLATLAPSPSEDELAIDWHRTVDAILRRVRAAAPNPGATADIEGLAVEVIRAERYRGAIPGGLRPAEAFLADDQVIVRAADGAVRILEARDEEGDALDLAAHVADARATRDQSW